MAESTTKITGLWLNTYCKPDTQPVFELSNSGTNAYAKSAQIGIKNKPTDYFNYVFARKPFGIGKKI
mgnify:CR=1 FL=1